MNKLIIIIIVIIVIIVIVIGVFLVFQKPIFYESQPNNIEKINKEKSKIILSKSCNEICKQKNYSSGECRSKVLYPNVKVCEKDEINIGKTNDCKISKKEAIGVQRTCCCINKNDKQEIIQNDAPDSEINKSITEIPFGINNAFTSSKERSSDWLKDLGVKWISSHIPDRTKIENKKDGGITYDFSEIDKELREYSSETKSSAWYVINIESKFQFNDGLLIKWGKNADEYIPYDTESLSAYGEYLKALLNYTNTKVPGWKVKYWSISNEHSSSFLPLFCEKNAITKECGRQSAKVYADIVEYSYKIIKEIDPNAKIIFGGPASRTPNEAYDYYYREALKFLKQKREDGYFDFFDYHNYNLFEEYKTNDEDKGLEYFRGMLANAGFPNKPIIIKEGATHSGMDKLVEERLYEYQTEGEQAEYLLKRFIYHLAQGVKLILWSTIRENEGERDAFTHNGLIYNGIPKQGDCDSEREIPCPDSGDGIKKLSYYTFKHLIEKLKGSDWNNIQTIQESDGIYIYKFKKESGNIWVAWNDNTGNKEITISGINSSSVKITEAIPKYEIGEKVIDYNTAFNTETKSVQNGQIIIKLGDKPVFVEE